MTAKLILLAAGGLLVALASREVVAFGDFWGWFAVAILFLLGQAMVRFEDYPGGKTWLAKLERYLGK